MENFLATWYGQLIFGVLVVVILFATVSLCMYILDRLYAKIILDKKIRELDDLLEDLRLIHRKIEDDYLKARKAIKKEAKNG